MSLKDKMRNNSFLSHPTQAVRQIDARPIEPEYGVERDGAEIVINLGAVAPFRVPVSIAIKLAMLILRKCGVEVQNG